MSLSGPSPDYLFELIAERVSIKLRESQPDIGDSENHWEALKAFDRDGWSMVEDELEPLMEELITAELRSLPDSLRTYLWCSLEQGSHCIRTAADNYEENEEMHKTDVVEAEMYLEDDLIRVVRSILFGLAEQQRAKEWE